MQLVPFPIGDSPSKKRVIICGSRDWTDKQLISEEIQKLNPKEIQAVLEGGCRGGG